MVSFDIESLMKRTMVMKLLKKINNIFTFIFFTIPFTILMLPIIVLFTLIDSKKYNVKKRFRFLINKGYIVKKDKVFSNVYSFINNPIIIKVNQNNYYIISYDNGMSFVNIYDTEIGSLEERNKLREVMIEYQEAHPVDKQRGDVVDTAQFYINFLRKYL